MQNQVKYLGHIVTGEGIKTNPEKIESNQNYTIPKMVKEVRGFIGLVGYYRKFIKDFSKTTKQKTMLTRKEIPFI